MNINLLIGKNSTGQLFIINPEIAAVVLYDMKGKVIACDFKKM